MAKEPRKSNRVKEVRKKEPLKDKSQRQKANKIPLRNSANANKLYSGGGGNRVEQEPLPTLPDSPLDKPLPDSPLDKPLPDSPLDKPLPDSPLDKRLKKIFQTILSNEKDETIIHFIKFLNEPSKYICDKLSVIEDESIKNFINKFIKYIYLNRKEKDFNITISNYTNFKLELTTIKNKQTDVNKREIENCIKQFDNYIYILKQHIIYINIPILMKRNRILSNKTLLLEEIKEIIRSKNFSSLKNEFLLYLNAYLKKTTYYCNNYIDELFGQKSVSQGIVLPIPCLKKQKIRKIYDFLNKFNLFNVNTNQDIDYKEIFLERLLLLLNGENDLNDKEIIKKKDNLDKQELQDIKQKEESLIRKKELDNSLRIEQENEKIKKRKEKLLKKLKKNQYCLLDSDLIDNIKGLSNITKIYLENYSSSLSISSLASKLVNIDTIILENFDLNNIMKLFNKLNLSKIKTLVLKHQVNDGNIKTYSYDNEICDLLNIIDRMTNLTHFEFSNFQINILNMKYGDYNEIFILFDKILNRNTLMKFYYYNNNITYNIDNTFFILLNTVINNDTRELKLLNIIKWLFNYPSLNTYTYKYIYIKFLDWLAYYIDDKNEKAKIIKEIGKIEALRNYKYKESKYYIDFNNKWLKITDDKDDKTDKTDKTYKLEDWFKFLIKIKLDEDTDDIDDIDERLYIIIIHIMSLYDEEKIFPEFNDEDDVIIIEKLTDYIRDYIVYLCEKNINNIDLIINQYVKKYYHYRPIGNITAKYKKMIIDYIAPPYITNQKYTTSIYWLKNILRVTNGGRKINSKSLLQPKKAPKKVSKVVLKEPNTYAVIKQKIRVKNRSQIK
jgi:hypothetical protein